MAGEVEAAFEKFKALGKDKLRELDDALAFLTKAQMKTPGGEANRELLKKSGVDPAALKTLAAYRAYKFKSKAADVNAFDSLAPPTDENGRPANPALRTDVRYEQTAKTTMLDGVNVPMPSDTEKAAFEQWLKANDIREPFHPDQHYDYVGAFRAGIGRDKGSQHFPDTFKLPGHETFSNESQYAKGEFASRAGRWVGERFIPPTKSSGFVGPPADMAPPIDRTAQIFGVTDPLDSGEPDVSPPTDEHGNPANPELAIDTFYETPTDEDGFRANKELRTDVRYGANPAHERMLGQVLSAAQDEERRKQQQQLPAAGLPLALALRGGL